MKRLFGMLLTVSMLLLLAVNVLAVSPTELSFKLTCDGEHKVSKRIGDIITVTFTLENATEDAAYDISSLTNEIYYDHTFFEFVEGSARVESGLNLTTKLAVYSWGEHRVYFNGFEIPAKQYAARQTVGSFSLRIIAESGSSTVKSMGMVASGGGSHTVSASDLIVTVGDAPSVPLYELTFEVNGGSPISLVTKEAGTLIDLSGYAPLREGYDFVGWYSNEELTDRIYSIELNGNTKIYAKWAERSSGGSGEGNPPDTDSNAPTDTDSGGTEGNQPPQATGSNLAWLWCIVIVVAVAVIFAWMNRPRSYWKG